MKTFTIYKIKNKLNNKVYIGQTCYPIKARVSKHIRTRSIIGLAIQKYGIENFEIKSVLSNLTIDETKQKISESMTKIVSIRDPISYAKMAATKKNKPIKSLYKKVKCLELDKIFESIGHAASELKIQRTGISMVLNGTIKTTGGYSFMRMD